MGDHLEAVFQIVKHGLNTNSYKFALLRALVALAPNTDPINPQITLRQLAEAFVQMYWPLEVVYHLRQGTDPNKDPIVMVAIRKLIAKGEVRHGQTLSEFKKKHSAQYDALWSLTEKYAFNDVIDRFHNVRGNVVKPTLFSFFEKPRQSILLTVDFRRFLMEYGRPIDYLAIAGWVDFNETITSAPKLFLKISGERPQRGNSAQWRNVLHSLQLGQCFYGADHDMSEPHVDHFLPWSYVLEDRTWNLVLTCRACNGSKSDRLPPLNTVEKLVERNRRLMDETVESSGAFHRHFIEWKSRDLAAHLRSLHDQAVAEQFPLW